MNEILRRQKNLKAWALAFPAAYATLFAFALSHL